jgi:recombinational DNA repair protein (RecF pathway)
MSMAQELFDLLKEAGVKPYIKWCADCGHLAHCTIKCIYPGCKHDQPSTKHRKRDGSPCP